MKGQLRSELNQATLKDNGWLLFDFQAGDKTKVTVSKANPRFHSKSCTIVVKNGSQLQLKIFDEEVANDIIEALQEAKKYLEK